jgi:hypothetical protein
VETLGQRRGNTVIRRALIWGEKGGGAGQGEGTIGLGMGGEDEGVSFPDGWRVITSAPAVCVKDVQNACENTQRRPLDTPKMRH